MTYIDFLRKELPSNWIISEESNINWDGNETIAIFKTQVGTRYEDSVVMPIQLNIFTPDILGVKAILETFIIKNHNKFFVQDFTQYIKQYYYSPIIPTTNNISGNQLTNQIILTGTLISSENVSDVKECRIDGELVKITTLTTSYASQTEAHVLPFNGESAIAKSVVKGGNISFNVTCINKNSKFFNKLRLIRMGKLPINTKFKLTLTYTDNDFTEEYICVAPSFTINHENGSLPLLTIVFTRG